MTEYNISATFVKTKNCGSKLNPHTVFTYGCAFCKREMALLMEGFIETKIIERERQDD